MRGEEIKNIFKSWNIFEILWLVIFSLVAAIISIFSNYNLFGFLVFLSGVLCVLLTAKGLIFSYIAGIFNTVGYAYISYKNNLFGETMLNILFFLPMAVIGFILWKKNIKKDGSLTMLRMNTKSLIIMLVFTALSIFILGLVLSFIPTQNTPYIDATTNALSVIAAILTAKRYREQWIIYITLNVFTVIMWSIRAFYGSTDGVLMIIMWGAYLVNAVYGFYNWSKKASVL